MRCDTSEQLMKFDWQRHVCSRSGGRNLNERPGQVPCGDLFSLLTISLPSNNPAVLDIDGGNFLLPNLLHYVPQLEVNLPSTAPQLTVFIIDWLAPSQCTYFNIVISECFKDTLAAVFEPTFATRETSCEIAAGKRCSHNNSIGLAIISSSGP